MRKLHPLTVEIFEFIRWHMDTQGYAPTLREIAAAVFCAHTTVLRHLDRLEGMGWIEREMDKPRAIRIGPRAPRGKRDQD